MLRATAEVTEFDVYKLIKEVYDVVSPLLTKQGIDVRLAPLAQEYTNRVTLTGHVNELRQTLIRIVLGMRNNILQKMAPTDTDKYFIELSVSLLSFNVIVTIEDNSGIAYEGTQFEPLANILENINLYSAKLLVEREMHGKLRNEYTGRGVKCTISCPNMLV
jgi:hypothetical protein